MKLTSELGCKKFSFVLEFEELINELSEVLEIAINIQGVLKTKGLSNQTINEAMKDYLQKSKNERIESFKNELYLYLRNMSEIGIHKGSQKILCSSDILESSFGKYKAYINNNKTMGITDLSLTIPAFINDFENELKILNAMQEVRVIDIANWKSKNIGKSLLRKRRDVLKKVG